MFQCEPGGRRWDFSGDKIRLLKLLFFIFFLFSAGAAAQPVVDAVFPDSTLLFYQGSADGVKFGDEYEIFRDDFIIGRAVAERVDRLYSFARLTAATMPIRRGDRLRKILLTMPPPEAAPLVSAAMFAEREQTAGAKGEEPATVAKKEDAGERKAPEGGVIIEEKTKKRLAAAENPLKFKFSGFHYLKYRTYGASGSTGQFISDSGLLLRGQALEQGSDLDIEATYKNSFKMGGHVYQMPLQERELLFDFEAGNIKATMGDFNSAFRTGALSPFNKKVSGGEVVYSTNKIDAYGLFSESKSFSESQSFSGNGTYGPYRINAVEILPGSETVQVNGETISKEKYQIDYFIGRLTFCSTDMPPACRVISESDRVLVVYEKRLVYSLRGEGITGLGAAYRPGTKFLSEVGFSFLTEEASGSEQQILVEGTYTITPAELNAQTAATERMPAGAVPSQTVILPIPTSSPIKSSGYLLMKPKFETVQEGETLLSSGAGYVIEAPDDYARGIIRLLAPAAATITVKYVYYLPNLVGLKPDEEIFEAADLEGSTFHLSEFSVYDGTEIVKECAKDSSVCNVNSTSCSPVSSGYTINEDDNTIVFTGNVVSILANKKICVAYYHVPSAPPSASLFDHTVLDVETSWSFGPLLGVNYEFARSEADVSKTPIQVVRERVTTFERSVTCPSEEFSDLCVHELRNDNIVDNSERITVSTSDTALTAGKEYFMEIDTGRLRFASASFATGTIVYANYQYNPPGEPGVKTGGAYTLDATGSFRIFDYAYKKQGADSIFSPFGGNNTLETDRSELTFGLRPADGLSLTYNKTSYTRAQDVGQINSTKTDGSRYSFDYSKGWLKSLKYSISKEDAADDRPERQTDYSRDKNEFLIEAEAPFVEGLSVEFGNGSESYSDKTSDSNNNDSNTSSYGFTYEPNDGKKYSIDTLFSRNTVDYFGLSPYSTTNRSRYIGFNITPIPLIDIAADINSQRISDSRPEAAASGLDKTTLSLTAKPFWKVSNFQVGVNQEDYPGRTSGSTRVKTSTYTFDMEAMSGLKITPTFTRNVTQITGSGGTSNNTRSLGFNYKPSNRPYEINFLTQSGKESSGGSGSVSNRRDFEFKYLFSEKMDASAKFTKNARNSDVGSATADDTFSLLLNYLPKEDWTLSTKLDMNRSSSVGNQVKRRNLSLASKMKVSKLLSWNLDYQLRKFNSPSDPDTNFNGNILETEIRAEF